MIVARPDGQSVVSLRSFDRVEVVDGGDTVVVHFDCAEHQPVAVMMPRTTMCSMVSALVDDLIAQLNALREPRS